MGGVKAGREEGVVAGEEGATGDGVLVALVGDGFGLAGTVGVAVVGDASMDSLASSLLTMSWVSIWPELPVMPWPSRETTSTLPVVAVTAPSTQAVTPMKMRLCTLHRGTRGAKRRLRGL